jgi:hypothetical protein
MVYFTWAGLANLQSVNLRLQMAYDASDLLYLGRVGEVVADNLVLTQVGIFG